MRKVLAGALAAAWLAGWGWVLGPAYSSSFFEYDQYSRIPLWLANLVAVAIATWSLARAWPEYARRDSRRSRILIRQAALTAAAWGAAFAVVVLLGHLPPPFRLSGDDAMGAGIDLALTLAWSVVAVIIGAVRMIWMSKYVRREPRRISPGD